MTWAGPKRVVEADETELVYEAHEWPSLGAQHLATVLGGHPQLFWQPGYRPVRVVEAASEAAMLLPVTQPEVPGLLLDLDLHPCVWAVSTDAQTGREVRRAKRIALGTRAASAALAHRQLIGEHWRRLDGLAFGPQVSPEGTLRELPGYDDSSKTWLERRRAITLPRTGRIALLEGGYDQGDAREACKLLVEELADFPFADRAMGESVWLAMLMTLLAPDTGQRPAFVVAANRPGAGKGLLAELAQIVVGGWPVPPVTFRGEDPAENDKALGTVLDAGLPVVCVSEVRDLKSAFLFSAITDANTDSALRMGMRRLGSNSAADVITLHPHLTLLLLGNQIELAPDMVRRVVLLELAGEERPEARETRRSREALKAWYRSNRAELLTLAVNVLRGWQRAHANGAEGPAPDGAFPVWSHVVRDALIWAGWPDCTASREVARMAVAQDEALTGLIHAWRDYYGTRAVTTGDLFRAAANQMEGAAMREALMQLGGGKQPSANSLAATLRRRAVNQFFRVEGVRYQVQRAADAGKSQMTYFLVQA